MESPGFGVWNMRKEKTRGKMDDSLSMLNDLEGIQRKVRESFMDTGMDKDQTMLDASFDNYLTLDRSLNDSLKFNRSITMHPDDFTKAIDKSRVKAAADTHQPWKSVTDNLFMDFFQTMHNNRGEMNIFGQVADFVRNCTDSAKVIEEMRERMDSLGASGLNDELIWLQNEKSIWKLVDCLYKDRLMESVYNKENREILDPTRPLSESEVVINLYRDDALLRQCQLVIDWLEQSAYEEMKIEQMVRPEAFTDHTVGWENTLHQLQNQEQGIPYASSQPLVTSMDPDAPLREQKQLHDLDQEDEVRLARQIFLLLRCGQLGRAQALCCHCGQEWRAATLDGWRLFHDSNYNLPHIPHTQKTQVEGNPNRDIWKLMAWRLAEDERVHPFIRASYGMLCGHLPSLLNVCTTWKDQLWARLRCSVDVIVEGHVRAAAVAPDGERVTLPDDYWKCRMSPEQVFAELISSRDARVRSASQLPFNVVLRCLVLEHIGELMKEAEDWVISRSHPSGVPLPHLLRFLAHLVLFFRQMGSSEETEVENSILRAYVKELMKMQEPYLVAFYVSFLPQDEQVEYYAAFLETIGDVEEKNNCLMLAEKFQLNLDKITKRVVENIRSRESKCVTQELLEEITAEDLEKIRALDFLVFFPSQRAEAIWQGNAIIRYFLASGKLEGANQAFGKIPSDSIKIVLEQYQTGDLVHDLESGRPLSGKVPRRIENSIREYFCFKAYLEAQESFSDWFQHYHNAKPKEPSAPQSTSSFTQRVAMEQQREQYKAEMERWSLGVKLQSKTVISRLYNVLLFPEGWLVDVESSEEMAEIMAAQSLSPENEEKRRRWQQMKDLRELYIPQ
ncbi:hypothetical protein J437_LFUL016880, partial [Ladona fulva]